MRLADIVTAGMPALCQQYHLNPYQQRALTAITDCRTGALGSTLMHCLDCNTRQIRHRSCGHRSCPQCQHHSNSAWLERQRGKRLPANYFMVTFTLPSQLRPLAYANPKQVYNALFQTALSTLSTFAHKPPTVTKARSAPAPSCIPTRASSTTTRKCMSLSPPLPSIPAASSSAY